MGIVRVFPRESSLDADDPWRARGTYSRERKTTRVHDDNKERGTDKVKRNRRRCRRTRPLNREIPSLHLPSTLASCTGISTCSSFSDAPVQRFFFFFFFSLSFFHSVYNQSDRYDNIASLIHAVVPAVATLEPQRSPQRRAFYSPASRALLFSLFFFFFFYITLKSRLITCVIMYVTRVIGIKNTHNAPVTI